MWCNDSAGNSAFNSSNWTINIDTVYPQIYFNPSTTNISITSQNSIFINVTAFDNNKENVFLEWNGVNESFDNSFGDYYWENKTSLADGVYSFRAYINDSTGNLNFTGLKSIIIDLISPNYTSQNQTINNQYTTIYHKGEVINLSAFWEDNNNLSYAWISTNETGIWENKTIYNSPQKLEGNANTSSFNWSNSSVPVGTIVSWKIYANDSAGNLNFTDEMSFQVWGYSEIGSSYLSPSGILEGGSTTMYCKVQDNITSESIQGYPVYFYNETGLMGTNITGDDGYATWSFSVENAGTYTITCNITDNSMLYYNISSNNEGQAILGVGYGLSVYDYTDTTNNKAYEGDDVDDITIFTPIDDPYSDCLLYTSPSPRDLSTSRMPSSA